MFSAIGRFFRALKYLFTGKVDSAADAISANPTVISATFDRVIEDKKKRLNEYKDAISAMIAQEENKKERLSDLTREIEKLEKLKAGAAARAKSLVDKYHGDPVAVKNDPEYVKCQSAFKDFTSTLEEKRQRATELDDDLKQLIINISGHKTQIQSLMRDLEKIKEEKHDAVADVLSAKEEKQIADMVNGISNDRSSEELQRLRDMRQKAVANARVSRELAGMDSKKAENEFLEYAQKNAANDEFDALIGLGDKRESAEPASADTKIPEA
ncbi:PspA/IM30 family protein [Pirellulaceae bacterium SH467]|jgi:phage shock protein A